MDDLSFVPRSDIDATSDVCSVEELEYEFLRLHERARKTSAYQLNAGFRAMFDDPVILLPKGADPTEDEFHAIRSASLRPHLPRCWVGHWTTFIAGHGRFECGPVFYHKCDQVIYASFGKAGLPETYDGSPMSVDMVAHRLANPRAKLIDLPLSGNAYRVNEGRAKSRFGLPPLDGFSVLTGVDAPEYEFGDDAQTDAHNEAPIITEGQHRLSGMAKLHDIITGTRGS